MTKAVKNKKLTAEEKVALSNERRRKRRDRMCALKEAKSTAIQQRKLKREQATRERLIRQGEERRQRDQIRLALRLRRLELEEKNRTLPEVKTLT